MKNLIFLFVFLFSIAVNFNLHAQLTGNKSIPGDYTTLSDAITALNANGVGSGGVNFNIAGGYTETASNLVIAFTTNPASASNPVIFQKSGGGANPLITAAPGSSPTLDGIIKLSGADYITFDRIDLVDPVSNTGDAMMEWGYAFLRASTTDGSQHNVIKNCVITLQKINTSAIGIYVIDQNLSGVTTTAADGAGLNSYNVMFGNSISNVDKGFYLHSSSTVRDSNNQVGVYGLAANNITNFGGSITTTPTADGIRCEGQINLKISNNVINGGAGTAGSSAVYGILMTLSGAAGLAPNYEISHNRVTITSSGTSQGNYGIRALATGDTVKIHDNIVEDCNAVLNTNVFHGIIHDPTGATNAVFIYNNIVRNNTRTQSGAGPGISYLLGLNGNVVFGRIYDNQVYGNQNTGSSSTIYCIKAAGGTISCESNLVYNNSIPFTSGTTASSIYGYHNNETDPAVENVFENTIYNLSIDGSGTSSSSFVAGIRSSSGSSTTKDFYANNIYGLNGISGNATTGGVVGIMSTAGSLIKIHRNKIFDITNEGTNGSVIGCWITSGTDNQIFSNVITDLKAPFSGNANAVIGINSSSSTANTSMDIYSNSIYLTASSSGTTFGSSGVSVNGNATATTASLNMHNNNIINLSNPGSSSGNTVAYRRSSTALQNYELISDYNNFYAGTPAGNRLIFFDGTNSDQLLAAYKVRVAPRDANSTTIAMKDLTLSINLEACAMMDTVKIQLRKTSPPYNPIDSANGLGGLGLPHLFNFGKPVDSVSYYVVVIHRNSIETWSKSGGEIFSNGALSYDFTTAATQAYGNNMVSVSGEWSLYTGDVNQDGVVDLADDALIDNDAFNFVTGYVVTDLNCDNIVDLTDEAYADNNTYNFITVVKP